MGSQLDQLGISTSPWKGAAAQPPAADPRKANYPVWGEQKFDESCEFTSPPWSSYVCANYPCTVNYLSVPGYPGGYLPYVMPRALPAHQVNRIVIAVHGGQNSSALDKNSDNHAIKMYGNVYGAWGKAPDGGPNGVAVFAPIFQDSWWIPYTLRYSSVWYWSSKWVNGRRPEPFVLSRDFISLFFSDAVMQNSNFTEESLRDKIRQYYNQNQPGYPEPGPSSYLIMDELIKTALKFYPKAQYVTLVGHSGGGTFVSHYAMMDRGITNYVRLKTGKKLRYIALNSGHYPYSIRHRKIPAPFRSSGGQTSIRNCSPPPRALPAGEWLVPNYANLLDGSPEKEDIRDYDSWPYGTGCFTDDLAGGAPFAEAVYYASMHTNADPDADPRKLLKYNMMRQDLHIYQESTDCTNWGPSLRCLQQGGNIQQVVSNFRASLSWQCHGDELAQATAMQSRIKQIQCDRAAGDEHNPFKMMNYEEIRNLMFHYDYVLVP